MNRRNDGLSAYRLATVTAGKNELKTKHNLSVPYAVLMMNIRKTSHIAAGGLCRRHFYPEIVLNPAGVNIDFPYIKDAKGVFPCRGC